MSKDPKPISKRAVSLGNRISEETRIVRNRRDELVRSYPRGLGLLSPWDELFLETFGDQYKSSVATLESSMEKMSLLLPELEKQSVSEDLLDYGKEQVEFAIQARQGTKDLALDIALFCDRYKDVQSDYDPSELVSNISHIKTTLKQLQEAVENCSNVPSDLKTRAAAAQEALLPALALECREEVIKNMPEDKRETLQRHVFELGEMDDSVYQIIFTLDKIGKNEFEQKAKQLQDQIDQLVVEKIAFLKNEGENEEAIFYLNLASRARAVQEANTYDLDGDYDPACKFILSELWDIKKQIEESEH